MEEDNFNIEKLGECKVDNTLKKYNDFLFVNDKDRIFLNTSKTEHNNEDLGLLELAGPREKIYFDPKHVKAGIMTCGGLCPGLNDVIRSSVRTLWFDYGVKNIIGIKYGYQGLLGDVKDQEVVIELNPLIVDEIHRIGGSFLGSSRGSGPLTSELVDRIQQLNLNILIIIGGDGTQKGALKISNEAKKRDHKLSVIGIPKTVDNDLSYIDVSFGFQTAVERGVEAIYAAHQEAISAVNGIGLVKLMGRDSGFIAAYAAIASHDANMVLIPELNFDLNNILEVLKKRIQERKHAVIVVAEGAGQEFFQDEDKSTDKSGNVVYSDIGIFLKNKINDYFKSLDIEINLKYIDPSYIVRSSVANSFDSVYCSRLGSHAIHAALSGRTGMAVSKLNEKFVNIPMAMMTSKRQKIDIEGDFWRDVYTSLKIRY